MRSWNLSKHKKRCLRMWCRNGFSVISFTSTGPERPCQQSHSTWYVTATSSIAPCNTKARFYRQFGCVNGSFQSSVTGVAWRAVGIGFSTAWNSDQAAIGALEMPHRWAEVWKMMDSKMEDTLKAFCHNLSRHLQPGKDRQILVVT